MLAGGRCGTATTQRSSRAQRARWPETSAINPQVHQRRCRRLQLWARPRASAARPEPLSGLTPVRPFGVSLPRGPAASPQQGRPRRSHATTNCAFPRHNYSPEALQSARPPRCRRRYRRRRRQWRLQVRLPLQLPFARLPRLRVWLLSLACAAYFRRNLDSRAVTVDLRSFAPFRAILPPCPCSLGTHTVAHSLPIAQLPLPSPPSLQSRDCPRLARSKTCAQVRASRSRCAGGASVRLA